MEPTTITKPDEAVQALTRDMAGKSKAEQARLVREYAEKSLGVTFEDAKVFLTDEQLTRVIEGGKEDARAVAREATEETIKRYGNLSLSEAKALADEEIDSVSRKNRRKHEDLRMAGKVLTAIHRAKTSGDSGALKLAYEEEHQYIQKNWGRQSRAMSLGTDSSGGYLGGEIFSTLLYENVARVSQARKYCTIINMEREILRVPTLTTTVTAEQTSEAGTITASQPVLSQFVLNTKKIDVLSKPFSVELMETSDPAIVERLIQWATIEIAKKEDALVFSTSGTGLLGQSTNNVQMGAGKTAITDADFDDMANLINELDEQYIPDDDIKGSGIVAGDARFWVPRALINTLAKSKGNDNYHWTTVQELKMGKQIHGFDVKRVVSMSQAPAVNTRCAVFGNLSYVWCGVRPGYKIDLLNQGTVDSVNLNETNSYAIRVTEFFDNDCIDDEAVAILKTAAA